ncbi:DUF6968 family protein [Paracraurococcus lichenis]|uniref:DUF6968 domain-containing protein n=1 Tax=Paracraurococcus lichenis TaxID=3064888 RepID=A0ABT9E520_9PROT|nr:hypothetical protein [Paracraurococcus sp. LOR1-02]MDO9711262.1 hypothetical protein [Paracraurococcus sp. LOR1-02]
MVPIASRVLQTALGDMRIELFLPERLYGDVACRYRIIGPRTKKEARAMGVDGFQALQLVMTRIAADLRASPEFEAGGLRWLDRENPGFPLPEIIEDAGWTVDQQKRG